MERDMKEQVITMIHFNVNQFCMILGENLEIDTIMEEFLQALHNIIGILPWK